MGLKIKKRPAWIFARFSRGSSFDISAGAPLALIATVAESERLDDFRLFALGARADFAPLVTCRTDGVARLVAHCHWFDLATLKTLLVRGWVFAIAVVTDGLASLLANSHPFDLTALKTLLVRGKVFVMAVLTGCFASLIAHSYRFDLATLKTLLVCGRVSVTSYLIAVVTGCFASLVALSHRFNLATLKTFLVSARVFAIDGLA